MGNTLNQYDWSKDPNGSQLGNLSFLLKNYVCLCGIYTQSNRKSEAYFEKLAKSYEDRNWQVVFTGSHFEGLKVPSAAEKASMFDNKAPVKELLSDLDFMLVDCGKVVGLDDSEKEAYVIVHTSNCHPGYMQLRLSQNGALLKCQDFIDGTVTSEDVSKFYMQMKGRTSLMSLNPVDIESKYTDQVAHGPAVTVSIVDSGDRFTVYNTAEIDLVASLHCKHWPKEAEEWRKRQRLHNWPAQELIEDIVSQGFHMVPVPHHLSPNKETEFRFSFSIGEKLLARSLNTTQRSAYLLMKILHYHHLKPLGIVSSFHMKTCLLWLCEQTEPEIWNIDNIGACFLKLVQKVMKCFQEHNLPNYFIPTNNMLDHISKENLEKAMEVFQKIIDNPPGLLFEVATKYNDSLESDYKHFATMLHSQGLVPFKPRGSDNKQLLLIGQILGPPVQRLWIMDIYLEQQVRKISSACMVHLLMGSQDNDEELALAPFHEFQSLLKEYPGFNETVPICLLLASMLALMLFSKACPHSVARSKAWAARRAVEKLLKLHQHDTDCSKYDVPCKKVLLQALMLNRCEEGKFTKNMAPLTYDRQEFEILKDDSMVGILYANYLIQHGQSDTAIEVLEKIDVKGNITMVEMSAPKEKEPRIWPFGVEYFCQNLKKCIQQVQAMHCFHLPSIWTGVLSMMPSFDIPIDVLHPYLLTLAFHNCGQLDRCRNIALLNIDTFTKRKNPSYGALVGHGLYVAAEYNHARKCFSEILQSAQCTISAMFLLLCDVKQGHHTKMPPYGLKSVQLESLEDIMRILSFHSVEECVDIAEYLQKRSLPVISVGLARTLHLKLALCEDEEKGIEAMHKVGVTHTAKHSLTMSKQTVAKYTKLCYMQSVQGCSDIALHSYFSCFLASLPSCADITAYITSMGPFRREPQPERTVKYYKHEKEILPEILQKELDTADDYEVPAAQLIFFSLCWANLKSKDRPSGAMASQFGTSTVVSHLPIPNSVFQLFLRYVLESWFDVKLMTTRLNKWQLGYTENHMDKDAPINVIIHNCQTYNLLAQIYATNLVNDKTSKLANLAISMYPGKYDAALKGNFKSYEKTLIVSYVRFQQGDFEKAFAIYSMVYSKCPNMCHEQCSIPLHLCTDMYSDLYSNSLQCKLTQRYLEYVLTKIGDSTPKEHIEHIRVTLALIYFHRYNELKEEQEEGEDTNSSKESKMSKDPSDLVPVETKTEEVPGTSLEPVPLRTQEDADVQLVAGHVVKMMKNVASSLADEDVGELDNLPCSIITLMLVVSNGRGSGVANTVMGNILYLSKTAEGAKPYLQRAVECGMAQLPLHVRTQILHHLVTDIKSCPAHSFMKCERWFELLAYSDVKGYFASYLVYAAYLLTLCYLQEGSEASLESFEEVRYAVGRCVGKDALFGVLCMKARQYNRAQAAFKEELHGQGDAYEKESLIQSLIGICHFLSVVSNQISDNLAQEICMNWMEEVEGCEVVLHLTSQICNHVYSINEWLSAANFVIQTWVKTPELPLLPRSERMKLFQFLSENLSKDPALGAVTSKIGDFYMEEFDSLSKEEQQQAEDLSQKIDDTYKLGETQEAFPIHSTSFTYGCFLLRQGKNDTAIEWGNKSHRECMKCLRKHLEDEEEVKPALLQYTIKKCLPKAITVLKVAYGLLLQPQKAVDLLKETYAVVRIITGEEENIVAALLELTNEIIAFKNIDALVCLYECMRENYGDSEHGITIAANLACFLFGQMRINGEKNNTEKEARITELFQTATVAATTVITFADYMNYLYNTGKYAAVVDVWKGVGDHVDKSLSYCNDYTWVERDSVDDYIRAEMDHVDALYIGSLAYCLYLNACSEYKLNNETPEESLNLLTDLTNKGECSITWRLIGYVYLLMNDKSAAKVAMDIAVAMDDTCQWTIPMYIAENN